MGYSINSVKEAQKAESWSYLRKSGSIPSLIKQVQVASDSTATLRDCSQVDGASHTRYTRKCTERVIQKKI